MMLTINNLTFERNFQILFSGISAELQAGEILQIKGANGSGKSTLLRIIAGFIEPQDGKVLWQNQCIRQDSQTYQQHMQYIGHQNGIKPYLTVLENLQLYNALFTNKVEPSEMKIILEKMGLASLVNTQAYKLSAGQARRLALARLLLRHTTLWILDEPTTALDSEGQALFTKLLDNHLQQGGVAVLTAHHDLMLSQSVGWIRRFLP